jgi:hypothetical protein
MHAWRLSPEQIGVLARLLVGITLERFGRLDIVVDNAGVGTRPDDAAGPGLLAATIRAG